MRRKILPVAIAAVVVAVVAGAVIASWAGGPSGVEATETRASGSTVPAGTVQARWAITDLGTLGGSDSVAFAINDRGQVVGTSHTANRERRVFLWERGRMSDLGPYGNTDEMDKVGPLINGRGQVVWVWPGRGAVMWANGVVRNLGTETFAGVKAINDRGQVVGWSSGSSQGPFHPFLWQNGRMTDLGVGDSLDIEDINGRGQIVGQNNEPQAFLWGNGKTRRLGMLSDAVASNDRSQVIGRADTNAKDPADYSSIHAMLWQNGTMTDLGRRDPLAINNRGEVILTSDDWKNIAYSWRNGRLVEIGRLGPWGGLAALNNKGQVVGSTVVKVPSGTQEHAFVWENGVMTDLGTLDGGRRSDAVAINNKGQIVGTSRINTPGQIVGISRINTNSAHAVLWALRSG